MTEFSNKIPRKVLIGRTDIRIGILFLPKARGHRDDFDAIHTSSGHAERLVKSVIVLEKGEGGEEGGRSEGRKKKLLLLFQTLVVTKELDQQQNSIEYFFTINRQSCRLPR